MYKQSTINIFNFNIITKIVFECNSLKTLQ